MGTNILVLIPVNEKHKRLLEEKAPSACFIYSSSKDVDEAQVQNANIIIGTPPTDLLKRAHNLKWLQLSSAGVGEYGKEQNLPQDTILTNASGAYGLAISEYMLGVLLELYKKLNLYRDRQASGEWSSLGQVRSIYGSVALIVGAGDIGCEFAKRLKALGAYTIGVRRTNSNKPDCLDELHFMDELQHLLHRADIISLSLPATRLTDRVINRDTLALMKQDAVLINVGRGSTIDTEALCDALENGRLLGAAMDVTDPEPLPKDHRLWKMKNAIVTPHVSGGYTLQETLERVVRICADNLDAYFSNRSLNHVVDLSAGY